MAVTYAEAQAIFSDTALRNKIEVALLEVAGEIAVEAAVTVDHAKRVVFANTVINGSRRLADELLPFLVCRNLAAANVAVILAASDAEIKSNVNQAVELFIRNAITV